MLRNEPKNGPDQLRETEEYYATEANAAVKLRQELQENEELLSIPSLMKRAAEKYPNYPALRYRVDSKMVTVTYLEYEEIVQTVAKAFLKLGLERHHGVCIIGYNSPEWMYSGLAAIMAGGIEAGIYTTNSSEVCLHCINVAQANIVIAEDEKQLEKILQIREKATHLKAIIVLQYTGTPTQAGVYSWNDIMEIGKNDHGDELENVLKTICVNECCMIIYTSGTTGLPKGAMLNHDNLVFGAKVLAKHCKMQTASERLLSYLPLSHIAAQMTDIFIPWTICSTIYIADRNALKGTMVENLRICRPTIFVGVPRVWEKIKEKLEDKEKNMLAFSRYLMYHAKNIGLKHYTDISKRTTGDESVMFKVYKYLIYNNIKEKLGLDCVRLFTSAGAPISLETLDFFYSLDIPVTQAYGLSESTAAAAGSEIGNYIADNVGVVLEGTELKIDQPDENGIGEICLRGRHVFMGYLQNYEATKEAFEENGWFRTGDLGKLENSLLKVTGRIKELIITAGGENIPFPLIEQNIKTELSFIVSNALLVGDSKKYLTVLLTLKTEINENTGEVTNQLTHEIKDWCRIIGVKCTTVDDVLKEKPLQIYNAIEEGIKRANKKAISDAQRVQKFSILPADFSIAGGELGPTMKMKRKYILEKYSNVVEEMYK